MSSKKDNIKTLDNQFMKLALSIARINDGLTGENPSVGCVVTKNNNIISSGVTSFSGRPHAETNALQNLKKNTKNSTIYITMEPCTHYGKTPPCTDLIVKSKINRVVYAVHDKDERTAKKASKKLKSQGIKVTNSICKKDAANFYKKYFFTKKNKIPYVIGKIACSNDNYIKSKRNKYITNEHSLNVSQLLRYRNEGILISYKTLNSDNPKLDCRLPGLEKHSPKRFILDKNLKSNYKSKIFNNEMKKKSFILHGSNNLKKINLFKSKKINLIKVDTDNGNKLNLRNLLNSIYKKHVNTLLVEGGRELTNEFISNRLFNEFYLFKSSNNLKKNGSINILSTLKRISKNFKKHSLLDTYTNKDKVIKFFNYV
tara:strand:+ start:465 stop:1577 length:1113 start_codon:yes stop_codon:yes gene_type:complete